MKRISWPLLLTIPLMVMTMSPVSASSSSETEPFHVHRYTLPNGLRVWLQPRPDSLSATAFLVIRAGYSRRARDVVSVTLQRDELLNRLEISSSI